MNKAVNTNLLGLELQELRRITEESDEPSYRAKQLFHGLYGDLVSALDEISTLPSQFRAELKDKGVLVGLPEIDRKFLSSDGTVRYLMRLDDKETIETVWMPEGDEGEAGDGSEAAVEFGQQKWKRATICVSSQVGCAVNCQFCLTALLGVKRNLSAGEIVGQVIAVLKEHGVSPPKDRVNLVFMGMGEPLLNFENFTKAVRLLVDGVGIPESRMTVSTAGIVPRIYDLGTEKIRPKLAISLNAPNDEIRSQIMPINRKWSIDQLLTAAREFPLRNREKLTFEYVLLRGVTDAPNHARELAERIRGMRVKVNLIALNPGPGVAFKTPEERDVLQFQKILTGAGIPAFIRRPRGRDIYAACGQLKRTLEAAD
ncbi:MAG TPA: 23S rRNA (adenine(2503)-C(2))-methyltransferase RlmN [Terriglobales bacterium]|nr:23S rRNA (adenine(2503)-C(2))-methyltransferase RlmN [Terriglobales bacterium]